MRLFTDHPRSVGESYPKHMQSAFGFGATMIVAGLACLVHGILPFLFKRSGSSAISRLHGTMVVNRDRSGTGGNDADSD